MLVVAQLVSDLDAGMDRVDQTSVDTLNLGLDLAHNLFVLVELDVQAGDEVGVGSALSGGVQFLVGSVVLLVGGHRNSVGLVMDVGLEMSNRSEVASDGSLVSSSCINQGVKSVLESSSSMSASSGDVSPVSNSALMVVNTRL